MHDCQLKGFPRFEIRRTSTFINVYLRLQRFNAGLEVVRDFLILSRAVTTGGISQLGVYTYLEDRVYIPITTYCNFGLRVLLRPSVSVDVRAIQHITYLQNIVE